MIQARRFNVFPVWLRRTAFFLYAAAQLCLAFAAFSEGQFGADARSHVESAGIGVHHAHDEADCAACAARALLSITGDAAGRYVVPARRQSVASSQVYARSDFSARASARPRAPPSRQA